MIDVVSTDVARAERLLCRVKCPFMKPSNLCFHPSFGSTMYMKGLQYLEWLAGESDSDGGNGNGGAASANALTGSAMARRRAGDVALSQTTNLSDGAPSAP
mgnify:CR=1 FL=1